VRRAKGLILAALLTASVAGAAEPAPASGKVAEVVVRGTRWIEEAAVLANVSMHAGDAITSERVRRDLNAVWGTGFFQDVRVLSEEIPGRGMRLIFQVVEKPSVTDVKLEGNKKIDEEDLRDLIDVKSFGVLNEAKVRETVKLLRDKYVEKGFYLAEINPEIVPTGENSVDVVFHIVENRKVIVQRIEFTGNDHVADRKFKKYMQTKEGGFAPWLFNTGTFDAEKLEGDAQVVQYVLLEEGYVDAKVDPAKVYLSPDKRYIYVSFHVEEGPKYEIGSTDVGGDFNDEKGLTKAAVEQIISGIATVDVQEDQWRAAHGRRVPKTHPKRGPELEPGETFKYSTMEAVRQAVTNLYQDQGYAFVNVIPQPIPNHDTNTVDIRFDIEMGEPQRVGHIDISGNDPTFDKVIRREILVNEGDLYRGSLIEASKEQLMRLGFFEDVQVSTPKGEGENVLDLNVKVTEQPTGSFSLGMGYSNLEKFSINANVQKNNFLGLGWIVNAAVNWSKLKRQANLDFIDPHFLDSDWTFKISGYWIERKYQLDEFQRGASVGVGRYLDRLDDVELRLDYTIEDVGISSLDAYRKRLLGGELFRNGLTSSVGLSFILDKRNNKIIPTKGIYTTASISMAGGARSDDKLVSVLGGDFNFVEAKFNLRWYQPLIPHSDMLIFRFNSSVGAVWSTDGSVIPYIHRYRAGGINSVRGFQWFSLGPTIRTIRSDDPTSGDDSLVVGGTQSWVNNFEIESPIVKAAGISLVAFFDAGNAFGDPWGHGNINPLQLRTAAGFGVRWRSPIGPLRFEWGFPLRPRDDETRTVFDFSIGSFF
jgi:outer membrane protein insertion porin family